MSQKICVVSFDHWNYDKHIVNTLENLNNISFHIKIGDYCHTSFYARITNAFSKVFFGKNLKKIRRQQCIIDKLDEIGHQDQVLVINPEIIDLKYHLKIKNRCKKYIAYLYDSNERHPVSHLLDGVFDEVYSFDKKDIKTFKFKETSNYIYLPQKTEDTPTIYDVVYVGSFDDRFPEVLDLAKKLSTKGINYKFKIIGKSKHIDSLKIKHGNLIEFDNIKLSQEELLSFYDSSKIILDLIRNKQTGLSFRFFEALALNKKIITNNKNVKNYTFYNRHNIALVNEIPDNFFTKSYQAIPQDIYYSYTIDNWVKTIFNL